MSLFLATLVTWNGRGSTPAYARKLSVRHRLTTEIRKAGFAIVWLKVLEGSDRLVAFTCEMTCLKW